MLYEYCTNYKLITRGILIIRTRARGVCTSRPVCHALVSSQGPQNSESLVPKNPIRYIWALGASMQSFLAYPLTSRAIPNNNVP